MILVTGGTGLAGSHLLLELTSQGKRPRALLRKGSSTDFVKHVFRAYAGDPDRQFAMIEWVEGDVLDIFSLEDAMEGVKQVYHNAALVSFDRSKKDQMYRINIDGTANVVNAALEKGVGKICHLSSIATLGSAGKDSISDESTAWVTSRRNSHYAISKYNGEREIWRGTAEGLDAVVILPSVILGLADLNNGSMQIFKTILKGLPFYTSGMVGYVDARDIAKAQVFLMESGLRNERYIVSAENLPYREVLGMVADGFGKKRPCIRVNRTLALLAVYFFRTRSFFSGKPPIFTRETARTALKSYQYSSEKFNAISGMEYHRISDTIAGICKLYLENDFFRK